LTEAVIEEIIKPILPSEMLTQQTKYLVNPTGRFVVGGPKGVWGFKGGKFFFVNYCG
jgi:S-adenosylmethionine synthetase